MSSVEPRVQGQIKWYNKTKGYGFIQLPSGGLDVFVHANQLRRSGIENGLNEGDRVTFVIDKGPKGAFATDIKKT
jgi:cold shock protein